PFDVGQTIRQGLRAAAHATARGGDPAAAAMQAANRQSQANGALMRSSPLALFGYERPALELADWARSDADLTHPHPVCRDASAAFDVAIQAALSLGGSPSETFEAALRFAKQQKLEADVIADLEVAGRGERPHYVHKEGWVRVALQNAFYQLL